MRRVYFVCPKTQKLFSATFDIPGEEPFKGMADLQCRQCGGMHRVFGRDAVKSSAAKKTVKAKKHRV